MRKRAKVATVVGACALCAVMAGGAAYAIAPSVEEAQEEVAAAEAAAEDNAAEAFSNAYENSAKLLELCGLDADGNLITFASGSPSITGAPQQASQEQAEETASADAAAVPDEAAADASTATQLPASSLQIFGNVTPYVEAFGAARAPDSAAGLWMGSDSTADGSWGYFIGHHPGVFNCVMYLGEGDAITVCDADGNARTYTVFAVYDVADDTTWSQISSEVTSHGESIALQTCNGDHATYRIVEAA